MAAYTTIDNPELYFQVKLWTGNSTNDRVITFDNTDADLDPDLIWIKKRTDDAEDWAVHDTVRGISSSAKLLNLNGTGGEETHGNNGFVSAVSADTFTLKTNDASGSDGYQYNNHNTDTYAAWCWKAGGSGSSNTDGSINTIKTSANTTSGFSINTFTGTQNVGTVGHGLGSAPGVMIVKNTADSSDAWYVYHQGLASDPETDYIILNTTAAKVDYNTPWNDTAPTSSVFTVGADGGNNESGSTMVAYCFAEKQGFSKFGSYTGNGHASDGPMIFLGFRPSFLLTKKSDGSDDWRIFDNKRSSSSSNPVDKHLYPYSSGTEASSTTDSVPDGIDFLSNGFKIRQSSGGINADGGAYIYMAFAEAPFVNSNEVPCNAR